MIALSVCAASVFADLRCLHWLPHPCTQLPDLKVPSRDTDPPLEPTQLKGKKLHNRTASQSSDLTQLKITRAIWRILFSTDPSHCCNPPSPHISLQPCHVFLLLYLKWHFFGFSLSQSERRQKTLKEADNFQLGRLPSVVFSWSSDTNQCQCKGRGQEWVACQRNRQ